MNKDIFWNITIGTLSVLLIGGGAYVMTTGDFMKNKTPDAQVATIETSSTDTIEVSDAQDKIKEASQTEDIKKPVKKSKTMIQDGVTIEIKKEGEGAPVAVGHTAVVHYTGMFTDGKVFDSSIPRGQTFPVKLGANTVIQGWEKGLVGMKKGEQRRLTIPPELGYGANGIGGVIPPNATLIFDVELVDIK